MQIVMINIDDVALRKAHFINVTNNESPHSSFIVIIFAIFKFLKDTYIYYIHITYMLLRKNTISSYRKHIAKSEY